MRRLAIFSSLLFVVSATADQGPAITFEAKRVVAQGVTHGGQVVWFSVSIDREGWANHTWYRSRIDDDLSGKGVVNFDLDQAVSDRSIWVVVDLKTGDFDIASPKGGEWQVVDAYDEKHEHHDAEGKVDFFDDRRKALAILVVRPDVGAWDTRVFDGTSDDHDGREDGQVSVSLKDMRPIGTTPAGPGGLVKGDVLIAIDPGQMKAFGSAVGEKRGK